MKKKLTEINMLIDDRKNPKNKIDVYVDCWIEYSIERNYGADSDGSNRTSFISINNVLDIMAHDTDGEHINLTNDEIEEATELLTRKFMEKYDN